jgi:hypothetical protein
MWVLYEHTFEDKILLRTKRLKKRAARMQIGAIFPLFVSSFFSFLSLQLL